jgi:hypothetical protein
LGKKYRRRRKESKRPPSPGEPVLCFSGPGKGLRQHGVQHPPSASLGDPRFPSGMGGDSQKTPPRQHHPALRLCWRAWCPTSLV